MKNNNFSGVLAGNRWPCFCLFVLVYKSRAEKSNKNQVNFVPLKLFHCHIR